MGGGYRAGRLRCHGGEVVRCGAALITSRAPANLARASAVSHRGLLGLGLSHELHVDVRAGAADAGLYGKVTVTSAGTMSAIASDRGLLDWSGFPPVVRATS